MFTYATQRLTAFAGALVFAAIAVGTAGPVLPVV